MSLTKKQKMALDVLIEQPFIKDADLGEKIGADRCTVNRGINHDKEFIDEWNRRTEIIWMNAANRAKERLIELMNDKNPNIALGATKAYMDKCLPNKTEISTNKESGFVINIGYEKED